MKDVSATIVNTDQIDRMDQPVHVYVQCNVPALTSELGSDTGILPPHGIVNSEEATSKPGPLNTLSQFLNTAHLGTDMNLRGGRVHSVSKLFAVDERWHGCSSPNTLQWSVHRCWAVF